MGKTMALAEADRKILAACEKTIERGKKEFLAVAKAFAVISAKRLYRVEYDTFASYCQGRWGFTSRNGNILAAAGAVAVELEDMGIEAGSVRAATAYSQAGEDEREAMVEAARENGVLDADAVETGKSRHSDKKRASHSEPEDDPVGFEDEPEDEDPREGFLSLTQSIEQVKREAATLAATEIGSGLLDMQVVNSMLSDLRRGVHACTPAAHCPYCTHNPKGRERCTGCKGTGYVSNQVWKSIPANLQNAKLLLPQR